jgi:hypothetical protein
VATRSLMLCRLCDGRRGIHSQANHAVHPDGAARVSAHDIRRICTGCQRTKQGGLARDEWSCHRRTRPHSSPAAVYGRDDAITRRFHRHPRTEIRKQSQTVRWFARSDDNAAAVRVTRRETGVCVAKLPAASITTAPFDREHGRSSTARGSAHVTAFNTSRSIRLSVAGYR